MGGAMRTPIRQADPTLERAGQRNVQNYLINPQAGQRDIGLETQAIASGMQVASALGKNIVALGNALSAADADAEYSRAWSSFSTWDSAQKIYYSPGNYPRTKKNDDLTSDIKELPTYGDMVKGYQESSKAQIKLITKDIKSKKARARFITNAANRQSQTLLTVSGWASNNHMEWLKGETLNCLYGSTTQDDKKVCLTGDNAKLSHTPSQLAELERVHSRRIANDAYSVELIQHWRNDVELDKLASRIKIGGERAENEDGEIEIVAFELDKNWKYLTEDDKIKRIDKIRQRQDELRKEGERGKDRALSQEVLKMLEFNGEFYDPKNIEKFAEDNPDFKISDITGMRNLLAQIQGGPDHSNLSVYGEIHENLEDWKVYQIAHHLELTNAHKAELIKARMTIERGGSVWHSKSNQWSSIGWEALQRLKDIYGVPEIGYFDPYMPGGVTKKQREMEKAYRDAKMELQLYMSHEGIDPDTHKRWLEEDKPMGAWKWVRQREADFNAGKVGPTVVDPTTPLENWQDENNDFTPSMVRQLPPGPIKDQLLYSMAIAGVDLGVEGVIDGKSLEQWIIDEEPGGPEAWMARLREMILGTDFHGVLRSGHPADGTPLSGSISGITTRVPEVDVLDQPAPERTWATGMAPDFIEQDLTPPKGGVGDFDWPMSDEMYDLLTERSKKNVKAEESKLSNWAPQTASDFIEKAEEKKWRGTIKIIPTTQSEPEPEPDDQAEWLADVVENTDSSDAALKGLGYNYDYLPYQKIIKELSRRGIDVLKELRFFLRVEDDPAWQETIRIAIKLYTEGRYDTSRADVPQ